MIRVFYWEWEIVLNRIDGFCMRAVDCLGGEIDKYRIGCRGCIEFELK